MYENKNNETKNTSSYPFGYDSLGTMTGFLFWQITHMWQTQQEKKLKRLFGISQLHYVILASTYWLNIHGIEVTQSYLSAHAKVEKMTVSKNVSMLQDLGYIERSQHLKDKRAKTITISQKGKELLEKAIVEIEKMDNYYFDVLKRRRNMFNQMLLLMLEEHDFLT